MMMMMILVHGVQLTGSSVNVIAPYFGKMIHPCPACND